ncbi:hypothetical protein [Nocardia sp. NPDC050435]|uniref:hypothetical protein n=1 Tax=Nocardia sp. NPDC050435 TaxID=3155040 RepID=UPI0033F31032
MKIHRNNQGGFRADHGRFLKYRHGWAMAVLGVHLISCAAIQFVFEPSPTWEAVGNLLLLSGSLLAVMLAARATVMAMPRRVRINIYIQ